MVLISCAWIEFVAIVIILHHVNFIFVFILVGSQSGLFFIRVKEDEGIWSDMIRLVLVCVRLFT
jgi:hypothetical protein